MRGVGGRFRFRGSEGVSLMEAAFCVSVAKISVVLRSEVVIRSMNRHSQYEAQVNLRLHPLLYLHQFLLYHLPPRPQLHSDYYS